MRSDFLIPGNGLCLIFTTEKAEFPVQCFSDNHIVVQSSLAKFEKGEVEFEIKGEMEHRITGHGVVQKVPGGATYFLKITKMENPSLVQWAKFFESRMHALSSRDFMSKMLLTCGPQEKIRHVIDKMNSQNYGSAVVLDLKGGLLGIVTERDVLRNCLEKGFLDGEVQTLMTESVTSVDTKAKLEDIYSTFKDASFRHLPVVEKGQVAGMISVRDLIRYWNKLLEIQSQNLSKKYEKAMSVIVHDLRSPIYAIRSINELVMDAHEDPIDWKNQNFPNLINDSCKSMIALIDDLLDMAELKSNTIRLRREEVDLRQEISKVAETFRPGANAKNISLQLNLQNLGGMSLDRRRVIQVLQNLISNAVKYTNKGGLVKINLKSQGKNAILEVIDHGQGIKKEEITKIFDEMCKISSTPTGGEASTGLGLSITKRIIEAHQGKIMVSSEPGVETKFSIEIPVVAHVTAKAA